MSAPIIITGVITVAAVIWLGLALDRRRFRSYREFRDRQSNAAWRPIRTDDDQGDAK